MTEKFKLFESRISDKNKTIDIAGILRNNPPALQNQIFTQAVRNVIRHVINELIEGSVGGFELKADKNTGALAGNFALWDEKGNLKDGNINAQSFEAYGAAQSGILSHDEDSGAHEALFGAKADKTIPQKPGSFAALDSEGKLSDSGFGAQDFEKVHGTGFEVVKVTTDADTGFSSEAELPGLAPGALIILQRRGFENHDGSTPLPLWGQCEEEGVLKIFWDRDVQGEFETEICLIYKNTEGEM